MSEQSTPGVGATKRETAAADLAVDSVPAEAPVETVTFTLDGREVTGNKGEMLIAAAERAGTFIPRFCYHPRMKSVGVCRMCLVEVSGPRGASLQPSCFVEVQPGSEVTTNSDKVKKAQDGVLEFLLINHPLDCPVCDKGGECPLQDQTLAYGPGESRFVEEKRHFEKPIPISELVLLDRERCIQCSRCTRFADEVAGEAQIDFIGRGEQLEVNTFPELPFASYFSGNTVQICPVGALTAAPYRFSARPWDLDQVESTCTTCSVGCRVAVQSSSNRLTRMLGVDSDPVNHGWLCDKGRFGFEAVNSESRLSEPLVRKDGALVPVSWHEALAAVADGVEAAKRKGAAESVGVIGGARLTNEGAYAWAKLAKGVIGTDSVDAQLGDGLPAEVALGLPRATIDQAAAADTVILLTGDLREELPILFLRLRSAVVDGGLDLIELSPQGTSLTPYAQTSLRYGPGDAIALARSLVDSSAAAPGSVAPEDLEAARRLAEADNVVIIVGRPSLAEDGMMVAEAAQTLARALPKATFLPALRRGNIIGALELGLAPGLLPGRVTLDAGRGWFTEAWGSVPATRGRDTAAMLAAAADAPGEGHRVHALFVLGADPLQDFPDRHLAERALEAADFVVAVASTPGAVTELADVVLPAAEAHERPGTTTNVEGRISRLGQKLVPPGQAWPDWMIASELAVHMGSDLKLDSVGAVWDEIELLAPVFRGITQAVLDGRGTTDGVVAPLQARAVALGRSGSIRPLDPIAFPGLESVDRPGGPPRAGLAEVPAVGASTSSSEADAPSVSEGSTRPVFFEGPADLDVPRVGPSDSYSVRLVASRTLYDLGSAVSTVPALAGLVATTPLRVNQQDLDALGVPAGGSVRLRSASTSAIVSAVPDASLPRKVVAADFNVAMDEGTIADFIDTSGPVVELRMETP
jgi:NADH-quinone oxidoreductase subunit G